MRIVVAPDSFKDCLSASVVAAILSDEISRQRPDIHVTECPLSDGGEGFTEIVTSAFSGDFIPVVCRFLLWTFPGASGKEESPPDNITGDGRDDSGSFCRRV